MAVVSSFHVIYRRIVFMVRDPNPYPAIILVRCVMGNGFTTDLEQSMRVLNGSCVAVRHLKPIDSVAIGLAGLSLLEKTNRVVAPVPKIGRFFTVRTVNPLVLSGGSNGLETVAVETKPFVRFIADEDAILSIRGTVLVVSRVDMVVRVRVFRIVRSV